MRLCACVCLFLLLFYHSFQETPLTIASKLLHEPKEMIGTLVEGGAHLDFRNAQGLSALHKAALADNYEALKVFLDMGLSPNVRDDHKLTPLYHAITHNQSSLCVERLLFDRSIVGITDGDGLTELHQACRFGRSQYLDLLLQYGADINGQTSKHGNTPLHICAFLGKEECARLLLFRGAQTVSYTHLTLPTIYSV